MKFQTLLLTACLTTFTVNTVTLLDGAFQGTHAEVASPSGVVDKAQPSSAKVLASGNFVASEHPTKGLAEVISQNGKNFLRLSKEFKSDEGPDLFVLLHREDSPKNYKKSDYVSLGRLKKVKGKQLYSIPKGVDITEFKSVVVWCKQFNATFGFAPLS
jgi:Electron transfer DM13